MAQTAPKGSFNYAEDLLSRLIFETFGDQRYTQDSPIMPDVWLSFARAPRAKLDLLLTPVAGDSPSKLATLLTERLAGFEDQEEEETELRRLPDAELLSTLAAPGATGKSSKRAEFNVAYSRSSVVAEVSFLQLVCVIVPMTQWWLKLDEIAKDFDRLEERLKALALEQATLSRIVTESAIIVNRLTWDFFRFCALVGFIAKASDAEEDAGKRGVKPGTRAHETRKGKLEQMMKNLAAGDTPVAKVTDIIEEYGKIAKQIRDFKPDPGADRLPNIFMITENRDATLSISESRNTVKADAVGNLFQVDARDFAWAVIDGGIDARHPAFIDRKTAVKIAAERMAADKRAVAENGNIVQPQSTDETPGDQLFRQDIPEDVLARLSRIRETYDFTYLRRMLALKALPPPDEGGPPKELADYIKEMYPTELSHLRIRTVKAREIDWDIVAPLIRVPHDRNYIKPLTGHGTHVAGILGGHWLAADNPENVDLIGVCPQIQLYDLRVYNPKAGSNEFTVQYALQFVEHLNRNRELPLIHGVNLSISMLHKVMSFACGRTPVCDECNDLVASGVVVVVAAGNDGYKTFKTDKGDYAGYHTASITDPGNAEDVITVGSSHRSHPHNYGVSYFSSRGPTGDGRRKPDLVAPGEKITAPVLNCRVQRMDGTSMAAPHVSGAAALLMARHRELIGNPMRIKEILCRTATDLGRESHFQGAGMVDILRAIQSL